MVGKTGSIPRFQDSPWSQGVRRWVKVGHAIPSPVGVRGTGDPFSARKEATSLGSKEYSLHLGEGGPEGPYKSLRIERAREAMENQKVRFFKKGGSLEDWLLQGGLLPNHFTWVDAKSHEDVWAYAEATLRKGCVLEYECYDWDGRAQEKACLRVESWGDVGRGYLVGDHLAASDGYYDWHGNHYLNEGKASIICVGRIERNAKNSCPEEIVENWFT